MKELEIAIQKGKLEIITATFLEIMDRQQELTAQSKIQSKKGGMDNHLEAYVLSRCGIELGELFSRLETIYNVKNE